MVFDAKKGHIRLFNQSNNQSPKFKYLIDEAVLKFLAKTLCMLFSVTDSYYSCVYMC